MGSSHSAQQNTAFDPVDFCGPNTTLVGGECTAPSCAPPTTCGPGTTLAGGECTAPSCAPSTTCGPGTELEGTECTAPSCAPPTTCGPGTELEGTKCTVASAPSSTRNLAVQSACMRHILQYEPCVVGKPLRRFHIPDVRSGYVYCNVTGAGCSNDGPEACRWKAKKTYGLSEAENFTPDIASYGATARTCDTEDCQCYKSASTGKVAFGLLGNLPFDDPQPVAGLERYCSKSTGIHWSIKNHEFPLSSSPTTIIKGGVAIGTKSRADINFAVGSDPPQPTGPVPAIKQQAELITNNSTLRNFAEQACNPSNFDDLSSQFYEWQPKIGKCNLRQIRWPHGEEWRPGYTEDECGRCVTDLDADDARGTKTTLIGKDTTGVWAGNADWGGEGKSPNRAACEAAGHEWQAGQWKHESTGVQCNEFPALCRNAYNFLRRWYFDGLHDNFEKL